MGTRDEIAIIYDYSDGWIGGVYYVQNLISAMTLLDDQDMPIINVYSLRQKDVEELKTITGYPYLVFQQAKNKNVFDKVINRLHYLLLPKIGSYIKA